MDALFTSLQRLLDMTAARWANITMFFSSLSTIGFADIYTLFVRWVFPLLADRKSVV